MAHMLSPTSHPDIILMKIYGNLTYEDMTCDAKLRLNERPMWVILDVTTMALSLPHDFLSGAMKSWFVNPNMQHLAIVASSTFLRATAAMVAKVTRRKEKMSFHESAAAAEYFMLAEIARRGSEAPN